MSTITTTFIIIGVLAAIIFLLVSINNKHQKRKRNRLLDQFSQAASENNLSLSNQQVLPDAILGLDVMNRKLLVLESEDDAYKGTIINLDEVKSCSVKRQYLTTNAGTLKNRLMEEHLQKLVLEFSFKDEKRKIEIPFFHFNRNHIYQLKELEQKAKYWEDSLSQFIIGKTQKTA
jgi:hypothetical protein